MLDKLDYFRDPNFVFDPIEHSYTYLNPETGKPIQIFESVSGFISQFKKPFDAQQISKYVAKARQQTQEEVLAEFFATICSAEYGIVSEYPNHFSYINSFLKNLKKDKKFIFKVSSKVQKAHEFFLDKCA